MMNELSNISEMPNASKDEEMPNAPGGPADASKENKKQPLPQFVYKFTATERGFTSGWTEATRKCFSPGSLAVVMTGRMGFAPLVEVTELVMHFSGSGREAPAPHVDSNGSVWGFGFNVVPLLMEMKSIITEKMPDVRDAFKEFQESKDFKLFVEAAEKNDEQLTSTYCDKCIVNLVAKMGNNIQVEVYSKANELQAKGSLIRFVEKFPDLAQKMLVITV